MKLSAWFQKQFSLKITIIMVKASEWYNNEFILAGSDWLYFVEIFVLRQVIFLVFFLFPHHMHADKII